MVIIWENTREHGYKLRVVLNKYRKIRERIQYLSIKSYSESLWVEIKIEKIGIDHPEDLRLISSDNYISLVKNHWYLWNIIYYSQALIIN